jgi:hypothetical protein
LYRRRRTRRQFDIPKLESLLPSALPIDPVAPLSSAIGKVTELVSKIISAAIEGINEIFEEINEGMEAGINQDFNIDFNLERKDRHMPLETIQNLGFTPKVTLIDSYASGAFDVGFVVKFRPLDFAAFSGIKGESAGDKFGGFIGGFLQEVSVYVMAAQEIKLGLQAEIVTKRGVEWFCAFWLWPDLGAAGCVVVMGEEDIAQLVNPKDWKFSDKKWGDMNGQKKSGKGGAWKVRLVTTWQKRSRMCD